METLMAAKDEDLTTENKGKDGSSFKEFQTAYLKALRDKIKNTTGAYDENSDKTKSVYEFVQSKIENLKS